MKFRSKPVEVEAVQFTDEYATECLKAEVAPKGLSIQTYRPGMTTAYGGRCHSRQGSVVAEINDWIIQESDGSGCYPCKPDVFAAKYEPV